MYCKDKTKTITLRLSDKQFAFVKMLADTMGTSKSNVVRGYINKAMGSKILYEYEQSGIDNKL